MNRCLVKIDFWVLLLHSYTETNHGEVAVLSLYSSQLKSLTGFKFSVPIVIWGLSTLKKRPAECMAYKTRSEVEERLLYLEGCSGAEQLDPISDFRES